MSKSKKMIVKKYNPKRDKFKKQSVYIIMLIIALIGALYQRMSIYTKANEYGRVGSLFDVNGVNMHLYTAGSGDLPIVFTSNIGLTVPYVETYSLHEKMAQKTGIAVYDKPGYGWSEITKAPRDIDTITDEIHTLMEQSGTTKPFILVAHGMGSLEVLRYAQRFPEDVAGVVLIDGAAPSFCADFNNIMIIESFMTNGLRNLGLLRLASGTESVQNLLSLNKELPPTLKKMNIGLGLEKVWNRNIISEKLKVPDNAEVILEGGDLGDIPLRIITSKANPYSSWSRSQSAMKSLSTDSAQTFIEGSVDYIQDTDVPAIAEVLDQLMADIYTAWEDY